MIEYVAEGLIEARISRTGLKAVSNRLVITLEFGNVALDGLGVLALQKGPREEPSDVLHLIGAHSNPS